MVCADFLLQVTFACVLVGGDQADEGGNYRNNGTYIHTSTHTVITNVFYRKEYRRLIWRARETRGDINKLKAELANAQSENLSMSRKATAEYSIQSSII